MKLSKTGWNNVIIFSVMIFILMINVTNKQLFSEQDEQQISSSQALLEENAVILTLMVDQKMSIERQGVGWQVMPKGLMTQQSAEQMMRTWHSAKGDVLLAELNREQHDAISISMMLAGEPSIQLFSGYVLADQFVIFNHQTGVYHTFAPQLFGQLLPQEIFL